MADIATPAAAKPSFWAHVKAWFYIPSNRTAFVAFLTGLVVALGHVLDHSVPLYAAAVPQVYAAIHLIFPDFNVSLGDVEAIAADTAEDVVAAKAGRIIDTVPSKL